MEDLEVSKRTQEEAYSQATSKQESGHNIPKTLHPNIACVCTQAIGEEFRLKLQCDSLADMRYI